MKKFFPQNKYYRFLYIIGGMAMLGVAALISVYFISFLLGPPKLTTEQNTIYYGIHDEVIGEESGVENRYWVDLEDISPHVINATLAIEDQHFYEHNGFDLKRIAGAVLADLKSMSLEEGASTLTQQYARNLFLSHEKTWIRKIKEAFYTIRIEMYYSKNEILEGYLNTIYFGHGAYGIEAASRFFYDKPASDLTLAEASMLAAIPKGPSYYSPLNDRENAEERQQQILATMRDNDMITEQQYFLAAHANLAFSGKDEQENPAAAPYFQDTVLLEAARVLDLDKESIRSGGYKIFTTLDKSMQKKLEKNAATVIDNSSEIQVGAMAMDPKTGGIRALIGGKNYQESQFNRAVRAKRMPGSTFKPFLYYAALRNGYTPSTMLVSKPTAFKLEDGEVYQPSNFNGYYANKPISLAQALALSDNVYAVKTNLYLGTGKLVDTARKFGINGKLPAVPSLALGTASVTVEDMVTGYGMIANGGNEIEGHTIQKIVNRRGKVVFERDTSSGKQVLDEQTTFVLTQLLTGIFDHALDGYMSVTGSTIAGELNRTYAAKSGTTNSDSWMIGYSPSLVMGVWTGYDNNNQIVKSAELAYAKDIWAGFMTAAHQDVPEQGFTAPDGVVGVMIDPVTGKRATPYCETGRVMYFEKGTAPKTHCTKHMPDNGGEIEPDPDKKVREEDKGIFEKLFDALF
ncbi:transglycosylase domain-containing protein [Virgibacillus siamensis]|uniref:Transglycosylase domain-containing protein n=1 Tax=Virgibacillus siamensis TaxID=480071 RepID=A0ABP3REH5_9BACI